MTAPEHGQRDQLAQETAEYIATTLTTAEGVLRGSPENPTAQRPPRSVEEIKATLLDGWIWISWMDDRVIDAMHALQGTPAGPRDLETLRVSTGFSSAASWPSISATPTGDNWPPVAQPGSGAIPERDPA